MTTVTVTPLQLKCRLAALEEEIADGKISGRPRDEIILKQERARILAGQLRAMEKQPPQPQGDASNG